MTVSEERKTTKAGNHSLHQLRFLSSACVVKNICKGLVVSIKAETKAVSLGLMIIGLVPE